MEALHHWKGHEPAPSSLLITDDGREDNRCFKPLVFIPALNRSSVQNRQKIHFGSNSFQVTSFVFTGTLIKVEPLNINQPVSDSMQQQLNQFLVMKFLQDYNVTPLGSNSENMSCMTPGFIVQLPNTGDLETAGFSTDLPKTTFDNNVDTCETFKNLANEYSSYSAAAQASIANHYFEEIPPGYLIKAKRDQWLTSSKPTKGRCTKKRGRGRPSIYNPIPKTVPEKSVSLIDLGASDGLHVDPALKKSMTSKRGQHLIMGGPDGHIPNKKQMTAGSSGKEYDISAPWEEKDPGVIFEIQNATLQGNQDTEVLHLTGASYYKDIGINSDLVALGVNNCPRNQQGKTLKEITNPLIGKDILSTIPTSASMTSQEIILIDLTDESSCCDIDALISSDPHLQVESIKFEDTNAPKIPKEKVAEKYVCVPMWQNFLNHHLPMEPNSILKQGGKITPLQNFIPMRSKSVFEDSFIDSDAETRMTNACHETADGFQTFSAIVVQQEGGLEALKLRLMNMTEKELMRTVLNMKVVKRTRVFDEKAAVVQLLKVKKAKVSIRVALDALHQGRPKTALKYLNCAIKEADENSEELFQAKKYRAEVFYNHCYYAEALQDLEDCLSAKALTEMELLVGLDLKARCLENLGKLAESRKCFMLAKKAGFPDGVHQGVQDILEQDWNLHISCLDTCCCLHPKSDWEEFSPGFQVSSLMADGVNRFVPTAAKCLELQSSEKYGRGFIAKDDLPPGTILISERPFARALSHSAADSHCNYCLTYCSFPIPCYKCKSAVFCSAKCQDMANDSYHLKYECESMAAILDKLEIQEGLVPRVVYRLFAQRTKTYFTSRRQLLDEALKAGWKPAGTAHNQLFDAQEVLSTLELFRHPVDPQKAAYEALLSVYIVKLLKGCGYFGSVIPATTELTSKDQQSDADILLISRLVLHYVRHLKTQTFTVSSVVVPCSGYESPQGSQVVGLAMCPTISFLNHSCVPNACVVGAMDEDKLVVVAMKGIAKGEQVLMGYGAAGSA
ncbi:unnamed protein product, partial [Notodromas monacha]